MTDTQRVDGRTFEAAFAGVERAAASLAGSLKELLGATKQLDKAAAGGDIAKIRQSIGRISSIAEAVNAGIGTATTSWDLTPAQEERYLDDGYEQELCAVAAAANVRIVRLQDRLAAYPSFVRILAGQRALRIDQKRVPTVRPSVVVGLLRSRQGLKARRTPQQTIEILYDAYRTIVGSGLKSGATLTEVYELLTLLPEVRRSYDKTDFAMDILLLDESGVRETKNGSQVTFPASTGTRDAKGVFTIPTQNGEQRSYYGIRFQEATP